MSKETAMDENINRFSAAKEILCKAGLCAIVYYMPMMDVNLYGTDPFSITGMYSYS